MKQKKARKSVSLFMALVLVFTTSAWSQALEAEAVFAQQDVFTDNMEEAPEQSGAEGEIEAVEESGAEGEGKAVEESGKLWRRKQKRNRKLHGSKRSRMNWKK